jgi:hypothetical protein
MRRRFHTHLFIHIYIESRITIHRARPKGSKKLRRTVMELEPNNLTMDWLVKWGEKLLGMTGILLSMPDGDLYNEKLESAKKKVLNCWKQFEIKKAFYLDLYKKSGHTDAAILEKHEDCRIWMQALFTLLTRLKQLS